MSNMKLKEIIWETSLACNKRCVFCGSKKAIESGKNIDKQATEVAQKISLYPPEELVLSGGEPGLLSPETIDYIFTQFADTGTKIKVISNGLIMKHPKQSLARFSRIGISVNTAKEMSDILETQCYLEFLPDITFVTNFGKHNIWEFQKMSELYLAKLSYFSTLMWQVQLTQGNEFLLPPEGIAFLLQSLDKLSNKNIVQADNLRAVNICQAGLQSCGILANGDVVPCLSYRSWAEDLQVQGNILTTSLKDIWETTFREQRFGKSKCCRDCIDFGNCHKVVVNTKEGNDLTRGDGCIKLPGGGTVTWPVVTPTWPQDNVYVYAPYSPPSIATYSVIGRPGAGGVTYRSPHSGGCGGGGEMPGITAINLGGNTP